MASHEVVLSSDDLQALNNGENVVITKNLPPGNVKVYPPCEDNGHDWSVYNLRGDEKISRRCKACGTKDEVIINDLDGLFEELKNRD